jgi:hypothetical protein
MGIKLLAGLVVLVGFAAPAWGADYFLDGAAGDDTHDGLSATAAWKTLDRANRHVFQPGDRLLLKAGTTFPGQLKPRGSGTTGSPIRIDRYGEGPKPQIVGGGVMPAALYLSNVEYWHVRNLDISNKGPSRQAKRCGVYVESENFGTAHQIVLSGLDVHDVNGSLVKSEGAGYGILWENRGREKKSRFDGLLIENCTVRRCERNGILGWSEYWRRTDWHPSLNVVIRNNLIEQVPGDGIVPIGCDGPLVEYNVMRDCPRLLPDTEAAAGIWPWSCDNAVIQFNEASDHKSPWDGQGFDSDWNCRNTVIQYNYSHDNEGGFLLVCTNGEVGEPINIGNIGTIVRYNVSINDGLRAIGKHAGFSPAFHISGPVKDTKIYNNLVYANRKPAGVERKLLKMDNWGGPWPIDTWFANNIFATEEWTDCDYGRAINTIFLNNLYWGEHRNMPEDPKAIRADPMFLHPGLIPAGIQALLGYRLQPGSAAIGAGMPIPNNGGRDFLGRPLPKQGRPAVGPLE